MDRIPFGPITLRCFGTDYGNHDCDTCIYHDPCKSSCRKTVPADESHFRFVPDLLNQVEWTVADRITAEYQDCYFTIFGQRARPDSPGRIPGFAARLIDKASATGVSPRLFMLSVMWGHNSSPAAPKFFGAMLDGEAAMRRVIAYKDAVTASYGHFDEQNLLRYAGDTLEDTLYSELMAGEQIAGQWITGYLCKNSAAPVEAFLDENEHQLPDSWLAISPAYHATLVKWIKSSDKAGTPAQRRKRSNVARLVGELKKDATRARLAFMTNESLMPAVISEVLARHKLACADIRVDSGAVWVNSVDFWVNVGTAIQHLLCWRLVSHKPRAEKAITQGSLGSLFT